MTGPRKLSELDSDTRALVLAILRAERAKQNTTEAQAGPRPASGPADAPLRTR